MADLRLRELERAAASGDPDAKAVFEYAKARATSTDLPRLYLALPPKAGWKNHYLAPLDPWALCNLPYTRDLYTLPFKGDLLASRRRACWRPSSACGLAGADPKLEWATYPPPEGWDPCRSCAKSLHRIECDGHLDELWRAHVAAANLLCIPYPEHGGGDIAEAIRRVTKEYTVWEQNAGVRLPVA